MKIPIVILSLFVLAGCGAPAKKTTKTTTVAQSAEVKPIGILNKGDVYADPLGRFKIFAPVDDLLPRRQNEGVALLGKFFDRSDISYGVLVFDYANQPDPNLDSVMDLMVKGIEAKFPEKSVKITHKAELTFKGYPAKDFTYSIVKKANESVPLAIYVTRFVKVGSHIYHLYYFKGDFPKPDPKLQSAAEQFFNNVEFGAK
jgi:hypothetical protein